MLYRASQGTCHVHHNFNSMLELEEQNLCLLVIDFRFKFMCIYNNNQIQCYTNRRNILTVLLILNVCVYMSRYC